MMKAIKKQALSVKLHGQLTTAVGKLSVEKLNRVLANVDKAVAKIEASSLTQVRKDNFLAQLGEIKTVVQNKIDVLTGKNPEELNLNDILSGVTTGPSNNTATGFMYDDANTKPMNNTIDGTGVTPPGGSTATVPENEGSE